MTEVIAPTTEWQPVKLRVDDYLMLDELGTPAHDAYAERREIAFGAPITSATLAGLKIETSGLA